MPNTAQLTARGREIAQSIKDIDARDDLSASQKSEALDKIQGEWDSHMVEVKNSERASELAAKMGPTGDTREIDGEVVELPQMEVRNLGQIKKQLAASMLTHPEYRKAVKALDDFSKPKSQFDLNFSVDVKDSTSANNIMGEGLYGTTGPSAVGQNPFLTGAFGPGILPTFLPGIVEQLFFKLTIADLISSIPVTTPDLSYLTESAAVMNSAAVAESALYPFSSETFSRVYEQVGKIANAAVLSDEAIKDAPQLFSFLQGRLIEGIQRQEEIQMLAGSGYPGVNGLLQRSSGFTKPQTITAVSNVKFPATGTSGAGVVQANVSSLTYGRKITGASTGVYPTATAIAEGIFDAFVDIQLAVFNTPNAIVLHPRDFEILRLAKDSQGQYQGGSFFGLAYGQAANAGQSLWGVPVVTTPAVPQGTILVGYFDSSTIQAARREGISMQMTNSNGTDFVNGNVTIRAEERLGLLVYRPSAFELIQLVNG